MLMTKFLHMRSRRFTRDPSSMCTRCAEGGGIVRLAVWRRDLTIESHRGFQHDERGVVPDVFGESFVQLFRFRRKQSDFYFDSGGASVGKSLSGYARSWVLHGATNAADSGGDDSSGARVSDLRRVFHVGEKCYLTRPGAFDCRDAGNLESRVAV